MTYATIIFSLKTTSWGKGKGCVHHSVCTSANGLMDDLAGSLPIESDGSTSLKDVSSYEDYIANIDEHLNRIESELDEVLKVSTLVPGGDGSLKT